MIQNNFVEHSSRGFTSLKLNKTFHLKVLIFTAIQINHYLV